MTKGQALGLRLDVLFAKAHALTGEWGNSLECINNAMGRIPDMRRNADDRGCRQCAMLMNLLDFSMLLAGKSKSKGFQMGWNQREATRQACLSVSMHYSRKLRRTIRQAVG